MGRHRGWIYEREGERGGICENGGGDGGNMKMRGRGWRLYEKERLEAIRERGDGYMSKRGWLNNAKGKNNQKTKIEQLKISSSHGSYGSTYFHRQLR